MDLNPWSVYVCRIFHSQQKELDIYSFVFVIHDKKSQIFAPVYPNFCFVQCVSKSAVCKNWGTCHGTSSDLIPLLYTFFVWSYVNCHPPPPPPRTLFTSFIYFKLFQIINLLQFSKLIYLFIILLTQPSVDLPVPSAINVLWKTHSS